MDQYLTPSGTPIWPPKELDIIYKISTKLAKRMTCLHMDDMSVCEHVISLQHPGYNTVLLPDWLCSVLSVPGYSVAEEATFYTWLPTV